MTRLLIRLFIKAPAGGEAGHSRSAYGTLSGGVGIVCNLLLSGLKFIIGSLTGSIAITADAANNLSDASSCVVTIVGSKYADKPADKAHPFGHGRVEYLAALDVSFFMLLMGGELLRSSVRKIIAPEEITFSWLLFGVLCLAIPVKLWMACFNRQLYKITGARTLKAVVRDSRTDCIATGAALAARRIAGFTS
ncbi:MAG: cation diffusion facilitator family transporter, partial [Clostridiales bacterium]|nr:cation diffusion facilitator family transporter [Clostridiales bacterium]